MDDGLRLADVHPAWIVWAVGLFYTGLVLAVPCGLIG